MNIKKIVIVILFSSLWLGCTNMDDGPFTLNRGLNVSHWLSQTEIRGVERENYVTDKDFKLIAELGFDHVRLPIDEEQMWNEKGERNDEAFKLLHKAIKWSFENNLRIIVDLHVLRSHHFNRPDSRKLWQDKSAQEAFIKYWRELSEELNQYPNSKLAYEPLNEAVSDNPEDWNNLINWVISEIRKLEPERTIIMGSNNWQQVGTFKDLKVPENDKNIILSFHYYEPFLLTHYQAPWTNMKFLNLDINYPGQMVDTTIYSILSTDDKNLVKELNKNNDMSTIEKEIIQAVDIAKKYDLKLYCGEFGAFPTTKLSLRQAWYKDMISIFNKYDIAWTHWNYKNDFPVVTEELEPINDLLDIMVPKR